LYFGNHVCRPFLKLLNALLNGNHLLLLAHRYEFSSYGIGVELKNFREPANYFQTQHQAALGGT